MRRLPPTAWILAPLVLGLLYAAGHALLAPRPSLDDLPPLEAVLVQRFRDLAAVDRCSFGPRGPDVRAARDLIADGRNLPGLPGVDAKGPLHMILMPRSMRQDSTLAVFAVTDASALRATFDRPDFIERGLARHAQELVIRGDWAAVGPDRDAARRIGTGGITAAARGEDHALAADVPRLVDHAAGLAREYPWRGLLEALGADVAASVLEVGGGGVRTVHLPGAERLGRIRAAWRTARLWAWMDERRLLLELEPAAEPLGRLLAAWIGAQGGRAAGVVPAPPDDAEVWLGLPDAATGALVATLLHHAGVRFPDDGQPPAGWPAALARPAEGDAPPGLLLWGAPALGTGFALSIGFAAPQGSLPDLSAFLPLPTAGAQSAPLPKGAAPLTKGDTGVAFASPKGTVERRLGVAGMDLVVAGASAREVAAAVGAHLARGLRARLPQPPGEDWHLLAVFGLGAQRAGRILGRALEPGGFLHCLDGGDLTGALFTDGRIVRLEIRVGALP